MKRGASEYDDADPGTSSTRGEPEPLYPNEHWLWARYAQRIGRIPRGRESLFPEFLFASPGKTGTTWLADVLRRHPDVHLPREKELHYFDTGWREHGVDRYLDHFAGVSSTCRGDATPNAGLPRTALRTIRELRPDVRWIVWLREPVDHMWSLIRHACRWREAPFADADCSIGNLEERALCAAALSDVMLTAVDPLGLLERLSSVFHSSQIHVGFLEDVETDPRSAIDGVFSFLGVRTDVDTALLRLDEPAFVGDSVRCPADFERWLREFLSARARAFDSWLRRERGRSVPASWGPTLAAGDAAEPRRIEARKDGYEIWAFDGGLHAVRGPISRSLVARVIRDDRAAASAKTRFELDASLAAGARRGWLRGLGRRRTRADREQREEQRLEHVASTIAKPWRMETRIDLVDVVGRYNLLRRTTRVPDHLHRWLRGGDERWFAVHHETGPIDLRFDRIGDHALGALVLTGETESSLRERLVDLAARDEGQAIETPDTEGVTPNAPPAERDSPPKSELAGETGPKPAAADAVELAGLESAGGA